MLPNPTRHSRPFPYFRCEPAFTAETCVALEQLFVVQAGWQARNDAFYSCFLRDVTAEISQNLRRDVVDRMRAISGLPLTDHVAVSAQRMEPGQSVGVHSDRPLLGYEIARLVVQLTPSWKPESGGLLELYATEAGPAVESIEPRHNSAFGFELHESSLHGVSRVTRTRSSVVFNFWHAANTPELSAVVADLFEDARFSELPASLVPIAAEAEAHLPEDVTFRASLAAFALQRWGYDDVVVCSGYQISAGLGAAGADPMDERAAALQLADWVAGLRTGCFDASAWQRLQRHFEGTAPAARLMPLWPLCLPESPR
jgi:hypothetical protein